MMWRGPTYRTVDGERIDGAWCHVWRRHPWDDAFFIDDLTVFADGTVDCGERTDLAGLKRMLATGLITVTEPGAAPPPEPPSRWTSRQGEPLTADGFLLDVADRVDELSGRPTAAQRCHDAIRRFQQDPDESHRALLRAAYLAVPPHRRIFVLGDMDLQDRPLRILLTDIGAAVDGDGPVVTARMHRSALDYFRQGNEGVAAAEERRAMLHADDPEDGGRPELVSHETVYPRGWPDEPGPHMLRNEFPASIVYAGVTYASVLHGYWALSAADPADRERIRAADSARDAHDLGGRAKRRDGWPELRLAVMAGLLGAKFTQHPRIARVLLATGDATISYTGSSDAPFWLDAPEGRGRNWIGRLLELTRSELLARERLHGPAPDGL